MPDVADLADDLIEAHAKLKKRVMATEPVAVAVPPKQLAAAGPLARIGVAKVPAKQAPVPVAALAAKSPAAKSPAAKSPAAKSPAVKSKPGKSKPVAAEKPAK